MGALKAGVRLRSVAGGAEVMVTRGGEGVITCGGSPLVPAGGEFEQTPKVVDDDLPKIILGKRYRTAEGTVEVLCVRQGVGALLLDGAPMDLLTQPKPLPASD